MYNIYLIELYVEDVLKKVFEIVEKEVENRNIFLINLYLVFV